jgi:hypothetical protein
MGNEGILTELANVQVYNSSDQNHEIAEERRCVCLSSFVLLNSTLEWFDIKYITIGNEGILTELAHVKVYQFNRSKS